MRQYDKLIDWQNTPEFNNCADEEFYEILNCCLKQPEERATPQILKEKNFYANYKMLSESDAVKIINYFM